MDQEVDGENSIINISDVIEVIKTDPAFGSDAMDGTRRVVEGLAPNIRILEQPASKALRFRYECEGRSAGSIPGVNSTPENKTYPTIKIENYRGRAMVLVSCVTKDPPYRPHPHNLVGKEGCKKGVCTVEVNTETMTASFNYLGIQCIKKKDIEEALRLREELRIDPFKTGFGHKNQAGTIDLNAVRLCFQVFLEGPRPNEFKRPISPAVVSEPIYDKKAMSDLVICKLSECSAPVAGGKEIILLCEKVAKEDISVRLYEEQSGHIVWEGFAEFTPTQVHKQVAISFRTPKYKTIEVDYPVQVSIQLLRPSDKATSVPLPFVLTPLDAGRPTFWSLRRSNKADYKAFASILQTDMKLLTKGEKAKPNVSTLESVCEETRMDVEDDNMNNSIQKQQTDMIVQLPESLPKINNAYSLLKKTENVGQLKVPEDFEVENFIDTVGVNEPTEDCNDLLNDVDSVDRICTSDNIETDCNTYSSLQMAMKNPCDFTEFESLVNGYEDVIPPRPTAEKPILQVPEDAPVDSNLENIIESKDEILPPLPPKRAKKTPPPKMLPPVPEGKSKFSLFSKLFSSNKRNKCKSREGSISSIDSRKSFPEVIKSSDAFNTSDVVLTEAEHYALYTSLAPHATASEFDEMSFYYSPVEEQSPHSSTTNVVVK